MRLSLLAHPALAPSLQRLLPYCPHKASVTYLSPYRSEARRQLRAAAESAVSGDTILLLDGFDLLPEYAWNNGEGTLIIPALHDAAALLIGAEKYHTLFTSFEGGISWFFPGANREVCLTPRADCQLLCLLSAAQLEMRGNALAARAIAQYNEWDYFEMEADLSILESLLCSAAASEEAIVFAPGETVSPHAVTGL